jgi:hypothetical protein
MDKHLGLQNMACFVLKILSRFPHCAHGSIGLGLVVICPVDKVGNSAFTRT